MQNQGRAEEVKKEKEQKKQIGIRSKLEPAPML
jgi:hypothetical protein